ncbi:alpha/beta hydrolase [Candidatus Desantisbacteria bacterium]|nr:alpha/beta hydrolase [Candidatus Desantisbacteria bacterium]
MWAIRNIEKVNKIVILDTTLHPDLSLLMKILLFLVKIPGIRNLIVSPSGLVMCMKTGVYNKKVMTEEVLSAYQAPFISLNDRQVLLKTLTSLNIEELNEIVENISKINVPIAIIFGEKDFLLASDMKKVRDMLPNAGYTILPDCGHFLQVDQPEKLSKLIAEFLA